MDTFKELQSALESVVLDPRYHAPLTLVKAVRNGAVYGAKVRFPHALVMTVLFRSGTIREKAGFVFKATKQHAQNLATFAFIYKSICLAFRSANDGKERSLDSFIAGLVGGYYVFGRKKTAVSQQIVIYVFARVCLAFAALAIQPPGDNTLVGSKYGGRGGMGILKLSDGTRARIQRSAWPAFASISWAFVMWLFKWYPDMLQSSLASSMKYIFKDSDSWDSLRTFIVHNRPRPVDSSPPGVV